jgi:hypothetical protein
MQTALSGSNFSGPQDPHIRVVKLILSGLPPPIHLVKPTLYGLVPRIRVAFPTLPPPYPSKMAQQAPQIATTWHLYRPIRLGMIQNGLSDSPTWPHIVLRPTKMPSRQLQTWPEDSPRRVTMNFSTDAKHSLNTSTACN